jgi:cysteinyl-tRNA synthetase
MSKSLGNLVMVSDLLKIYSPDALRLYLGSHHYREAWSYDEKDLQESQKLADMLSQAHKAVQSAVSGFPLSNVALLRYWREGREGVRIFLRILAGNGSRN